MLPTLVHIHTYNTFLAPETCCLPPGMDEWSIHLEMISLVMLSTFVTHSHLKHPRSSWDMRHETPGGWVVDSPEHDITKVVHICYTSIPKTPSWPRYRCSEAGGCYLEMGQGAHSLPQIAPMSTLGNVSARISAKVSDRFKELLALWKILWMLIHPTGERYLKLKRRY